MNIRKFLIITTSMIFSISGVVNSQSADASGPSLADTYTFLKTKVDNTPVSFKNSAPQFIEEQKLTFKISTAAGSRLVLRGTHFLSLYHRMFETTSTRTCSNTVTLDLAKIIPSSIKVTQDSGVFLVSMKPSDTNKIDKEDICSFTGLAYSRWPDGLSKLTVYAIFFNDKETAEKVAKALTHAAKLNGGKEELF